MADPTVPWGIPLFDDNDPFAPVQAPLNAQSAALNAALSDGAFAPYATKALLDAAPGTRVGQHATVYADTDTAKNGDYRWGGSEWAKAPVNDIRTSTTAVPNAGIRAGNESGTTSGGGDITVTFPTAFTSACWSVSITDTNISAGIGAVMWKRVSQSATGFTARAFPPTGSSPISGLSTSFDYIAIGL